MASESDDDKTEIADDEEVLEHSDPDISSKDETNSDEKKFKYGVIYLSYIPDGLNVKTIRDIMSRFGQVGRIYLEPEENSKKKRTYLEGWVEFKKKRVAKMVAEDLNNTPLSVGKKQRKWNGQVWSIKYLHRFKWAHLTEQLAHDKAIRDQSRRFELKQAKKQIDFYQKMTERSKRRKKLNGSAEEAQSTERMAKLSNMQNKPKVKGAELSVPVDEQLLTSIFRRTVS